MDITTLSIVELKALAYDMFAQVQFIQSQLATLNAEIEKKSKEVKEVTPEVPAAVVE